MSSGALKTETSDSELVRRTPRRLYRRPVGVLVGGRYEVLEGRGLSEDGALIAIGDARHLGMTPRLPLELLPVGTQVSISLLLPTGASLVIRGRVAHHEGDVGSGHLVEIKFDAVPLHERREIRKYVSSKQVGEADSVESAAPRVQSRSAPPSRIPKKT